METKRQNRVVDLLHRMLQIADQHDRGTLRIVATPIDVRAASDWHKIEETLNTAFLGWETPTKAQQEFIDMFDILAGLFYQSKLEQTHHRVVFKLEMAAQRCLIGLGTSDKDGILWLHWNYVDNKVHITFSLLRTNSLLQSYCSCPAMLREFCGGSILDKAIETCGDFYSHRPLCTKDMISNYNSIVDAYVCDGSERRHGQYGLQETLVKVGVLDPSTFVLSRELERFDDETGELKELTASTGNVFLIEF